MANSHVPRREISHSLLFVQGNCVPSGASVTLARRKYNIIEVSIAGLSLSLSFCLAGRSKDNGEEGGEERSGE